MFIEILRFIWSFVPSFRSEYFPFKLICPYWFWSRTREAVMAYLEKYWNFTWSFLPFFQIRVFSLQVDLSQLILIKNQGSSHGILIKIKKRSGFLPLFLIRVFSLQVDLSQLILIKKQGSTHGNFIKILKFFGGVSSIFSDQWSKWLSTWSVSSRIRENLSHFYVHKMTTINHCDNKWGAMLCVPSILVISYSFPSSRSLPWENVTLEIKKASTNAHLYSRC